MLTSLKRTFYGHYFILPWKYGGNIVPGLVWEPKLAPRPREQPSDDIHHPLKACDGNFSPLLTSPSEPLQTEPASCEKQLAPRALAGAYFRTIRGCSHAQNCIAYYRRPA
jgi:hypothetical protein